MVIGTALLPDGVTDTVATTPPEMAVEFNPQAIHVDKPAAPTQDRVLPAEVNAGPAATVMLPTLAAG